MLRKFAAVLIAATMFTAPVLAQTATPAVPAQTSQPTKAPAVNAPATTSAKVKHVKIKKHHVKKDKVVKHTNKHRRHVRHVKPAKPSKRAMVTTAVKAPAKLTVEKSAPTKSN